jgi:O-antigen ligase
VVPAAGMLLLALVLFYGQEILEQVRFASDTGTAVNTAGSNSERAQLAELAIDQFEARPLQGVGFGVIADAHNIYLQLLAAGGVIAMASFLVFVAGIGASVRRALAGPQRDAAAAAGIAILMWLINGVVDNQVADKYLYVVPGLLVAMAYVATAVAPAGARRASPAHGATRAATPSLAGVR